MQKATLTVRDKVAKVEDFSNYFISPMRKRNDIVFRSTTVTFKAIRCWLNLELSDKAPRHWLKKRQAIDERILSLTRCPKKGATIEEVGPDETEGTDTNFDRTNEDIPKVKTLKRTEIDIRLKDIPGVLQYNILKRENNKNIQQWKSYPGVSNIVSLARKVTEEGDISNIERLAGCKHMRANNLLQLLQQLQS